MIKKIFLARQKIRPLIVLTIKKLGLYEQAVAYKRKYFKQDFWDEFIGKTTSDDILLSAYMNYKGILKMVMSYDKEEQLIDIEEWRQKGGVLTFPVIKHTSHEGNLGCNDPNHGPRFMIPEEFIQKGII